MPAFVPPTPGSSLAFVAIVVFVVAAFLFGVRFAGRAQDPAAARRRARLAAAAVMLWVAGISAAVGSGALASLPLGGVPFFFGGILLVSVATGLSPLGGRLAGLPLAALVGFQAFRLPLELVLHNWVESGTIPATMTWTGQNWDIASGALALLAAPFAHRHRAVAWTANIVGAILLLNVIRVALLSSPVPFGWNVTPPLLLAWHLPFALIAPVCVGGALIGHIVLTRALLARRGSSPA